MEIHAPERPIHSFKDFFVHIGIVTVGILIALGLEGVREALHTRHLVRETRDAVHLEMGFDQQHARDECSAVLSYAAALDGLAKSLPLTGFQPQTISSRLASQANPGYFFAANSWVTALSTGVLAHLPTAEVSAYANAAEGIRRYIELQTRAQTQESIAKSWISPLTKSTPEAASGATRELLLFSSYERDLAYVCPQVQNDIEGAERASAP